MTTPYPALFEPLTIGHLRLRNRIMSTSHAPAYAEDGMPKERYRRYHEEKAKGGLALSMFGGSSTISIDSPPPFGQINLGEDRVIPWLQSFSEGVHRHGCATMIQITHMGRRTGWSSHGWLPTIAPSAVREPAHRSFPKAMDRDDIERVIGDFAAAARRAQQGGLDGCELSVHLKHLYRAGVTLTPDVRLLSVRPMGNALEAKMRNVYSGETSLRAVDQVVVEHGTLPAAELIHALEAQSGNHGRTDLDALARGAPQPLGPAGTFSLFRVGDAVASRNIHAALYDSLRICKDL